MCHWCSKASELAGKRTMCKPCYRANYVNRAKSGAKKQTKKKK